MRYEPTPDITEDEVRTKLLGDNPEAFAAALRSAAMYLPSYSIDRVLALAVARSSTAAHDWAIAEAIIVSIQARGYVPAHAVEILNSIPDSAYSYSRDEALELVSQASR